MNCSIINLNLCISCSCFVKNDHVPTYKNRIWNQYYCITIVYCIHCQKFKYNNNNNI